MSLELAFKARVCVYAPFIGDATCPAALPGLAWTPCTTTVTPSTCIISTPRRPRQPAAMEIS